MHFKGKSFPLKNRTTYGLLLPKLILHLCMQYSSGLIEKGQTFILKATPQVVLARHASKRER